MKCSVCGTEFYGNNGICPGCGYFCGRGNGPYKGPYPNQMPGADPQYQNAGGTPYMPYYQSPMNQTRVMKKRSYLMIIGVAILLGAVAMLIFIGSRFDSKNYDFGSFTMDLPTGMKEDAGSTFVSYFQTHGGDAGEYANKNIRFAYAAADGFSGNSPDRSGMIVDTIADTYKNYTGYELFEKTRESLKFKMDYEGMTAYCHFRTVVRGEKIYYLFLVCNFSQRSRYEDRFDKYMNSFTVK